MAIVKANYVRGTSRTARKAVMRAASYYTFRDGPDQHARTWHASDGRTLDYETAKEEIGAGAATARYTYRVVLSTKDAALSPDDYHHALAGSFERYYFVEHRNTDHPHAHVIGFTEARLHRQALKEIRAAVREREQARTEEQARTHGHEGASPSHSRHARSRERDAEQGIG